MRKSTSKSMDGDTVAAKVSGLAEEEGNPLAAGLRREVEGFVGGWRERVFEDIGEGWDRETESAGEHGENEQESHEARMRDRRREMGVGWGGFGVGHP